ncbi:hypothetical protein [Actinopolymorpha alba]|nr:hypothetical protein [Actinopolymorpha alba]
MTEAQRLAYRALQESLDRRDNGGRSGQLLEWSTGPDDRDTPPQPATGR